MALRMRLTELSGIEHPVVLGGMRSGGTGHALVAAVSSAAGLGTLSATSARAGRPARGGRRHPAADRSPFALNHVLCFLKEERFAASLALPMVVRADSRDALDIVAAATGQLLLDG